MAASLPAAAPAVNARPHLPIEQDEMDPEAGRTADMGTGWAAGGVTGGRRRLGEVLVAGKVLILRQDPDIVMVGEIRDPETASIAMQASMTLSPSHGSY